MVDLRRWEIGDAKTLANIINNKKIQNNLRDGMPFPYSQKDAEQFIENMLAADPNNTFAYAITLSGEVVGSIAAFRKDNIHAKTAEVGYYLDEKHWGQGIGTRALQQLCAMVFRETDIMRLFAEPFATNAASCKILEKAGFQYEGLLTKNAYKNGEFVDMKMYALIKPLS